MKRILYNLLSACFLLGFSGGCTGDVSLPRQDESDVSVQLYARGGALEGTADNALTRTEPGEAFTAAVALSTVKGDYSSLNGEYDGIWNADVSTGGAMTWKAEGGNAAAPVYPKYGDYLYLVAYAPIPAQPAANGKVVYTLTGQEDLLYAEELQGTKWDGGRFSGNTNEGDNKPLRFEHLLTRLSFEAQKAQAGGPSVKITKITVNGAQNQATVPLATGAALFNGNTGLSLTPANGVEVNNNTLVPVGNLMLPPTQSASNYTLTVVTSVKRYENVDIAYKGTENLLQAGMSHKITLSIADDELSVTSVEVNEWNEVEGGDLEIKN